MSTRWNQVFLLGILVLCSNVLGQSGPAFHRTEDVVYGRKYGLALILDVFQPVRPNGCGLLFLVNGGWNSSKSTPLLVTVRPDDYQIFSIVVTLFLPW